LYIFFVCLLCQIVLIIITFPYSEFIGTTSGFFSELFHDMLPFVIEGLNIDMVNYVDQMVYPEVEGFSLQSLIQDYIERELPVRLDQLQPIADSGSETSSRLYSNNTLNMDGSTTQNLRGGSTTQNLGGGSTTQNLGGGSTTAGGSTTQNQGDGSITQNQSSGSITQNQSSGSITQNQSSGSITQNQSRGPMTHNQGGH